MSSRRRVSLACTACRVKRTRCDGQLPECGTCLKTGRHCEYVHDAERRKPPSKRYVEALHSRIEFLERQLKQYNQAIVQGTRRLISSSTLAAPRSSLDRPKYDVECFPDDEDDDDDDDDDEDEPGGSLGNRRDPVDDLTDMYGRLDIAEDGHLRYFGASSYFNMLKRPQYDGSNNADPLIPSLSFTVLPSHTPISTDISKEVQDHLLDFYWKWQNPWQYLVHKDAFCRALQKGRHDEYCTPLLLYSVLALAARYSDDISLRTDPRDANTAGDALQQKAKFFLQSELEHPTVSTVVSLAILALREMSTNKEAIGWTYIGIAVRIAYNLGLNLDCTPWLKKNIISEEEAEIRKIAWWGCYLLDKLFCIGLGRPSMIKEWDITALRPSLLRNVEYSPWEICKDGSNISISMSRSISNMHYMCKIFQIVSSPLDQMLAKKRAWISIDGKPANSLPSYAPNSHLSLSQKEGLASKTHLELTTFYNNLPSFLKLPRSAKTPHPAHSYSLHLQYQTVTILLHRPFLRRREQSVLSDLISVTDLTHNQICTASAESITSILRAYRTHYTLRRIPISAVHAVGTGSVIHLLDATSQDPITSRAAIRQLKFNMTCLKEMSIAWTWGLRAIRTLQILAEGWAMNELLQAHGDKPSATEKMSNANNPTGDDGNQANISANMNPLDNYLQDIDWLLDFESGLGHEPVDINDFQNGFWSIFP